jgi:hypothetical protein
MITLHLPDGTFHSDVKCTFAADGLVTSNFFRGSTDEHFRQALATARSQVKHALYHEWRLHFAVSLIEQAVYSSLQKGKSFVYVECGVGEGHTLLVAHHYFRLLAATPYLDISRHFLQGEFLLIDTFTGVDPALIASGDSIRYKTDSYHGSTLDVIKDRFNMIENLRILAISIPAALSSIPAIFQRPSFLHIDMNHDVPEREALSYFRPRMRDGLILLDDYSFNAHKRQRISIDNYCEMFGYPRPLNLPTGQGLIYVSQ